MEAASEKARQVVEGAGGKLEILRARGKAAAAEAAKPSPKATAPNPPNTKA